MRWKISICLLLFTFLLGAGVVSYTSGEDSLKYQVIEMDSARFPVGKEAISLPEEAPSVDNAPGEPWAKELFPNSKLIWEKEFDGKIRDIKVGGENVVVFWEKDRLDIISYLDFDGSILWKKSFKFEQHKSGYGSGTVRNISISRNGESVIINFVSTHWDDMGDRAHVNSYDKDGNLKWETTVYNPGLALSPNGDYAITTCQSGEEMKGFFRLFDNKTGEELWSDVEKKHIEKRVKGGVKIIDTGFSWSAAWLNDSEVIYVKGRVTDPYCKLILFDAKKLQKRWEVDIGGELGGKEHFGVNWYTPRIKVSNGGQFIAIVADYFNPLKRGGRTLVMLNDKGNILWHGKGFVTSSTVFSTTPNNLFIGCSGWTIELSDAVTGERKWQTTLGRSWEIDYAFILGENLITSLSWAKEKRAAIFDLKTGELQRKPEIYDEIASIVPIVDSQNKLCALILLDKDKKGIQKLVVGQ